MNRLLSPLRLALALTLLNVAVSHAATAPSPDAKARNAQALAAAWRDHNAHLTPPAAAKPADVRAAFAPRAEAVKPATALPSLSSLAHRAPRTAAGGDTFLVASSAFDVVSGNGGGCNPRGWTAEDLSTRVFTHVSDRFLVNNPAFSWTPALDPPTLPATVLGTPILTPQAVASNDSGMVFFIEPVHNATSRIVAVYPDALDPYRGLMRTYADVPSRPGLQAAMSLAFDKATGGLILGTSTDVARSGRLYRIPAGGGAAVQIAGGGIWGGDTTAFAANLENPPEEIVTDAAGNIYFTEISNYPYWPRVRMLRTDGRIVTLAGAGFYFGNDGGDGGPALNAILVYPRGLAINAAEDTLYELDPLTRRVRSISLVTGIIDALPGAQAYDFDAAQGGGYATPFTLGYADGNLYVGCSSGRLYTWSGGTLTRVAGGGSGFAPVGEAFLGTSQQGGQVADICAAPGGGVAYIDASKPLVYRNDAAHHFDVIAGVAGPMYMGFQALWFGADSMSAPDEVAHWVDPYGYGAGWGQRLTSPEFSFASHPNARLSFDARVSIRTQNLGMGQTSDGFFGIRGLQADGTWRLLPVSYIAGLTTGEGIQYGTRIGGSGFIHAEVDLSGQPLAGLTRLQFLVETHRFASNEDGFGTDGTGAVILDNVSLKDGDDEVLPFLGFDNESTGDWQLSAVNAPYGYLSAIDGVFTRDVAPPANQIELRTDFDFSDPSCAWTFTAAGDSVPDGTYSRITSPWIGLPNRTARTAIAFSGKLATDNQKRYLKAYVRAKNAGDLRPSQIIGSGSILSSGTSGSDLSSPYLDQVTMVYPDDFDLGTEGNIYRTDSIQVVLQIEDRIEEQDQYFPNPRTRGRLPYLDDIRVYQEVVDQDGDGVADAFDACPTVSSAGQDADGDGCPDATASLRHVETWQNASRPIHYRISLAGDPAIADGSDLTAIRDAIAAWQSVPGADVPMVEDAPTALKNADLGDAINLITFEDDLAFPPDVIAVTPTTSFTSRSAFDDRIVLPGQIVDSDLIFNPDVVYRTAGTGPLPESVDLQSVATHEIGHMLGLSHSGVPDATMFPVLATGDGAASLEQDDRGAIVAAYPSPLLSSMYGKITGTVARGNGAGPIPGALVTAWLLDPSNHLVQAWASDYSDESGHFSLWLPASVSYAVRIDPLDGSIPGLVPEAINARVRTIAQTNFHGEWWSVPEDGTEPDTARAPIAVTEGSVTTLALLSPRDITPPTIVGVLPAEAATGVNIDGRVLINFSEPVDPGTISSAFALRITGESGRLGGTAQIIDNNRTFIYTPSDPLEFDTNYEIEMTTALTDREGVALADTIRSHFQTLPTPQVAIFDIQPRQGPRGSMVTIRGQGFTPGFGLETQSSSGTSLSFGSVGTLTSIVFVVDIEQTSGPIRVLADGVYSNPFNFTVIPPTSGLPQPSGAPVQLSFSPTDVAVSPEGANAFAVGLAGFSTINLSPARPLYRQEDFEALPGCSRIALSPDGRRAYVTRPESHEVVEFVTDATSPGFGHSYVTIPMPGVPDGITLAADGQVAYVTESQGSRVWAIDVDPTDAQYRGIEKEYTLPGITLTGGASLTTYTSTALAAASTQSPPPRPRLNAGSALAEMFLTSTSGLLDLNVFNGGFETKVGIPSTTAAATTIDGTRVVAAGAGGNQSSVVVGCLGACFGLDNVAVGGQVRDVVVAPDGAVMLVNSQFAQIQVMDKDGSVLHGVVSTGRTPVALATSSDAGVIAVANAGDNTIGLYAIEPALAYDKLPPPVAFPGDKVALRLQAPVAPSDAVDLSGTSVALDRTSGNALAFTVPALSPRRVDVAVSTASGRSPSEPMTILEPIEGFAGDWTGTTLQAPVQQFCGAPTGRYVALRVTPDGSRLVTVRHSTTCGTNIELIELRDQAPQPRYFRLRDQEIGADNTLPVDAALSPDGNQLWLANGSGALTRYNIDPASPVFGSGLSVSFKEGDAHSVAFSPFAPEVAACRSFIPPGSSISFYDLDGLSTDILPAELPEVIHALAWAPDGHMLLAGGRGRVFFIDGASHSILGNSLVHTPVDAHSIVFTSDGARAIALWEDGFISVFDMEGGGPGNELYYGNPFPGPTVDAIVATPGTRGVIAGSGGAVLYHADLRGVTPDVISGSVDGSIYQMASTPDGRFLFTSSTNSQDADSIRVYTLGNGTQLGVTAGDGQEALYGQPLANPVRVRLSDAGGHPQVGAEIHFTLADAAQGALVGSAPLTATRITDVNGEAEIRWTMPATPGAVQLTAEAPGLSVAPLVVHATSAADPTSAVPEIVAFGPPEGALGIAAGTEVFVRFTQSMDSTSAPGSFRLAIGGDVVPGTYRLENGGRTVFFRPAEPLPYLAHCTLRVDAGMLDAQGQALAASDSASFTVQALPTLAIATLAPPAGVPGTEVTITGEGFGSVPAQNTVQFNGTLAPVVSASTRVLVVRVPADATSGDVTVLVASTTSNGKPFVVLDPNAHGGAVADTVPTRPHPLALAITPDGRRMYVTSPRTNTVGALDIRTASELAVIPVGANPRAIAILPDGSRAYTANYDGGDLTILGTNPGTPGEYNRVLGHVKVGAKPVALAVQRRGPQVLVVNEGDQSLSVVDAQSGNATFDQVIKNIPLPGNGGNMTISPDGTRAFILTSAGVTVIDLSSFVIKNIPLPGNGGNVTISPDGGLLYVIGGDHHLYVIAVGVGSEYRVIKNIPLPGNGGNVTISPDGTHLYVVIPDQNLVLEFVIEKSTSNGNGTSTVPGDAVKLTLIEPPLSTGNSPAGIAADPFGRFVAVVNQGSDDASLIATSTAAPTLHVTYPNGGETLVPGTTAMLTWDTDALPVGQSADLAVSRDLGLIWEPIATGIDNLGSYAWLVTGPSTAVLRVPVYTALLRVTAHNVFADSTRDQSDQPFTIFDQATATTLALFTAEGRVQGVELRWRLADPAHATAVTIERSEIEAGPWTAIEATRKNEGEVTVATDATAAPGRAYFYRLTVLDQGARVVLGTLSARMPVLEFALRPIAPNPARDRVAIDFAVARSTRVRLAVIDVAGRRVASLVDGVREPGLHHVVWDGTTAGGRAAAGLYFVRYDAADKSFVRRFVFVR